jgi:hypothetical protein
MRGSFVCTVCGSNGAGDPAGCSACGPRPILSAREFGLLEVVARTRLKAGVPGREALLRKLDRALVLPAGRMPAEVVRLRSQVLFGLDGDPSSARNILVPAGPAASDGLPVLSALGLVLLGLRERAVAAFADGHGCARRATVLRILRHLDEGDAAAGGCAAVIPFATGRPAVVARPPRPRGPRPDGAA